MKIELRNMESLIKIKDYYPNINNIPNLVKSILYHNGFSEEEALEFIQAEHSPLISPFQIYDVESAAKIIHEYIKNQQKIIIHSDFDVDGICACTILWDYFYNYQKANIYPIIPNRNKEGYGLSESSIQRCLQKGGKLIITADCGIKDIELISKYKNEIDFIVTDHHQFAKDDNEKIILPEAKAIVHPLHPRSNYPIAISGAATAWQLVKTYQTLYPSPIEVNIDDYLDLLTISTICDIVPLRSENRKLYLKGIHKLRQTTRVGLKELIKAAGIQNFHNINSYHIGFIIGPRLNAPGRVVNDAMDAVRLLSTRNTKNGQKLAQKINQLNQTRRNQTQVFFKKAEVLLNPNHQIITLLTEQWPEGILGLIATKIAEKYEKPVFIATINEENIIVGSARCTLENISLMRMLKYAQKHFVKYGGHEHAAGFKSVPEKFKGFENTINEYANLHLTNKKLTSVNNKIQIQIDDLCEIQTEDVQKLSILEPYGTGNPRPLFVFKAFKITSITFSTNKKTELLLSKNLKSIKAITFDEKQKIHLKQGMTVDAIGYLYVNDFSNSLEIKCIKIIPTQVQYNLQFPLLIS